MIDVIVLDVRGISCILGTILSFPSYAYHSFRNISGVTLLYASYVFILKFICFWLHGSSLLCASLL